MNEVTRITRQSRTLIDHVFSNADLMKATTDPLLKISDHETLVLNINDERYDTLQRKYKCWNRYSKEALCYNVVKGLQHEVLSFDEAVDILWNSLKGAMESLVIERTVAYHTHTTLPTFKFA